MPGPQLTGFNTDVTFNENTVNAAPQLFVGNAAFNYDNPGALQFTYLYVTGLLAEDRVSVRNQGTGAGQIGLSGSNITYGGVIIGTIDGGVGTDVQIFLNDHITVPALQALFRNLTYADVSDTPTADRSLTLSLKYVNGVQANTLNAGTPDFTELTGAANPFSTLAIGAGGKPALIDVDNDGDKDLAVGGADGTVRYFRNDGGTFTELTGAANPFKNVSVGGDAALTFKQIEGSADLDLIVGNAAGQFKLFSYNNGFYVASSQTFLSAADIGSNATPAIVDIFADGNPDMFAGAADGTIYYFENGSFQRVVPQNPFYVAHPTDPPSVVDVGSNSSVAFGDFDGDGDFDAVVGAADGKVHYFENTFASYFPTFYERTGADNPFDGVSLSSGSYVQVGDFDGDNDADLLVTDASGAIHYYRNNQHLTQVNIHVNAQSEGPSLIGVDPSVTVNEGDAAQLIDNNVVFSSFSSNFNGGHLIIGGVLAEDRVAIQNQGTGAGQIGVSGANVTYQGVTIGTFSGGSGDPLQVTFNAAATVAAIDALVQSLTYRDVSDNPTPSHDLSYYITDAFGQVANLPFTAVATEFTPADPSSPLFNQYVGADAAPAVLDFDHDGDLDIVAGNADGHLSAYRNDHGTYTPLTGAANPFNSVSVGAEARPVFIDYDGDGDLDIVVGALDGTLHYFKNNAGTYVEQTGGANPFNGIDVGSVSGPAFVDIDGDGDLDLVVAGASGLGSGGDGHPSDNGTLFLFRNTGGVYSAVTGVANPLNNVAFGQNISVVFGDFDGDGDPDLVQSGYADGLRYYENTGTRTAPVFTASGNANPFIESFTPGGFFGSGYGKPTLVDFDGDGDLDVVVGTANGGLYYFRNDLPLPTITVAVNPVNDAPVVTGGPVAVTGLSEDAQPSGQLVSDLVSAIFSDPDTAPGATTADLAGIAITANGETSQGHWQYSANGFDWTDVGSASASAAVEVAASGYLRFVGATNFNGPAPQLTAHLIDSSAVVATGDTVDLTSGTGGSTPYSSGTFNIGGTVQAVNDAPVATGTSVSLTAINQDDTPAGQTVASLLGPIFSDAADNVPGGSSANGLAGVLITFNSTTSTATQGVWQFYSLDDGAWEAINGGLIGSGTRGHPFNAETLIRFLPAAGFFGAAPTLTAHLIDDSRGRPEDNDFLFGLTFGGTTAYSAETFTIGQTVVRVNVAPVLSDANVVLSAVNEDAGAPSGPVGTLVSALVDLPGGGGLDNVTDVDAGGVTGIALTATSGAGTWFYSTNNGVSWAAVGAVSDSSARLLAADTDTRLYYQPDANFVGTVTGAITFRAWDTSTGANGALANTSSNGGSTAFSIASDTADITVTPVNDPPVVDLDTSAGGSGVTLTYTENSAATAIAPAGATTDIDSANYNGGSLTVHFSANGTAEDQLSILATGGVTVAAGVVSVGGHAIGTVSGGTNGTDLVVSFNTDDATQSAVTTLIQHIGYSNSSDNPSAAARTLSFTVDDGDGGSSTGSADATINVTATNDAPVAAITPTEYDGSPNVAINLKNTGLSVSDVDGNAGSETVTLSVTSGTLTVTAGGSGAGVAGSGTSSVTITGTIAQINALLSTDGASTVSFVDSVGGNKTLTLLIHDNGNTGSGDLFSQDTATIVVDQPPVLSNAGNTVSYTEQAPGIFIDGSPSPFLSGITVSDPDAPGVGNQINSATVTISGARAGDFLDADNTGVAGISISWNGTDTLTLSGPGTIADYQAVLRSVVFSSSSDDPTNGGANAARTITWVIKDISDVASTPVTSTINLTAENDGPAAVIAPATYSATEQTALDLKASGLSVSDADANTNSVTVTLSVTEGTLSVTAGGSGAGVAGSGTSTVTLTGSIAQINALLTIDATSAVSYTDGTDNPSTSATLTLAINDGGATGGGVLTAQDTATINITAVNDAPIATITPVSYAVTENATLDLKNNGLSVGDIDGNAGSETVTLSVTDGILNVTAGTSGAVVTASGTNSVTITGTIAQINALLVSDGTSTVNYAENDDNPGTSATLSLAIHDNGNTGGGDLSSTDTAVLNITQVNDAPAATIAPVSYSATEQTALNLKNNGLAVSDIDGNSGSETVTLSVGEGVLNVTAGGSGAGVAGSGTNTVTITGSAAQINALLTTDGTSTVSYIDNSDTPAAITTLTLLIHDNGNTGGGDLSSSASATINVTAVNDVPVLGGFGDTPTFVENGASVLLDTNGNMTVSDPELNVSPSKYEGATLTIARSGGPNPDDAFAATGTLDVVDSDVNGNNVSLDGGVTFIGKFVNNGDGSISFTFNASATAADIDAVMRQIVYSNSSDNPDPSVQVDFTFDDGNGHPGGQPQGTGPGVTVGSVTMHITQVDDAPVLLNVALGAAYSPGSAGVVLSSGLGVFDVDATAPSALTGIASATVKIASGFFAGDGLFVNLATSGGHFIVDDGSGPVVTNISVASNAGGTLVLSGQDTTLHYQFVLDAVSYFSTAADPSNGGADTNRTITWQVNDGVLNSPTPNPGPNNLVNATILHFDTAPTVDLDASGAGTGFTTTYTENQAPIAIVDTDVSIVDPDTAALESMTIVLTNAKAGDALSIEGALPGGITSSIDTSVVGQITVHLTNSASLADYQTALGAVRFASSSEHPDTTDRDITVLASESDADSNVAHATIHVVPVNDAPVAANGSVVGNEDTAITGAVSASDVDNTAAQLSYALIGTNGGAAHGTVALNTNGSFTYTPTANFNGSDSFSFKANDGSLDSNAATESVTVSPVNDAPVAANGSAAGNEDTAITGAVSATDVDNTAAQLSYALVGANGGAAHGTVALNANGSFTYTPAANFNGSDSFSFKANDGSLDSNAAVESLTVAAVNDGPVNTVPGPLNTADATDLAIAGLAVSDPDAVSLTTTLHVDNGIVTVGAGGGATIGGSGTATVTLSGSVAQIDAALGAANNVVYRSTLNFSGTDHLTMTSDDAGSTGSGGAMHDIDTVDIHVAAIQPVLTSVTTSGSGITAGSGDLNAGHVVTLTANFNEAVIVDTAGGTPTLSLNDGGVAAYVSGSGSSALNFNHTVAAGQNTSDLAVTAANLNGGAVHDAVGHTASLAAAVGNPAGTLQIDTIAPHLTGVSSSIAGGDLEAGSAVNFVFKFDESVKVAGGTPTLSLNTGGSAVYDAGATAALGDASELVFHYVVGGHDAGTQALAITDLNLNGAALTDLAGNAPGFRHVAATFGISVGDAYAPPHLALIVDHGFVVT